MILCALSHTFFNDIACELMTTIITYIAFHIIVYLSSRIHIELSDLSLVFLLFFFCCLLLVFILGAVVAHVHNILDEVVSELVDYQNVESILIKNMANYFFLLFIWSNVQDFLDDSAAVLVLAQLINFGYYTLYNEIRLLACQILKAFLYHMISILIFDQLNYFLIS